MEENHTVKYKEDEYVFGNESNLNESEKLNKSNEEINGKKQIDDESNKEENLSKNDDLNKNNQSKENMEDYNESQLFDKDFKDIDNDNNSKENEKSKENISKKEDSKIEGNKSKDNPNLNNSKNEKSEEKINQQTENKSKISLENIKKDLEQNNNNNNEDKEEEDEKKNDNNQDLNNLNKKENESENPPKMNEINENEALKESSLIDKKKEINKKVEEEKEKNKDNKENKNMNNKEEILDKKENEKKEENIETKNKNDNDSENIIDDIIKNELEDIQTEEIKLPKNKIVKTPKKINEEDKNIEKNSIKKNIVYSPNEKKDEINEEENFQNGEIIKNFILSTTEKILDDNLERIKAKNDIELANIVQYELDKNLSKLELRKSADNFKKEKLKLKSYEILLNKRKRPSIQRYKTLENKTPIITNSKTPNENIKSFYIGKKQNEYDFYKQKLSQKLEKIELLNLKKNERYKMKKSIEAKRAEMNLKKSEEQLNKKIEYLKKKMEWKDLMTAVIKNVVRKDHIEKAEYNKQKYLLKKDYINYIRKKEQNEREEKLEILNKKAETRKNIKETTNRIYSSRIDKYHNIEKERKTNISKIQKILKNGEGENEKNLDILMEEFPDNYRIANVIKDYQIKKNEIENNQNIRLLSSKANLFNTNTSTNFKTLPNNFVSKSLDKRRIFLYTPNKAMDKSIQRKNERIKNEERKINNMSESKKTKKDELIDVNDIHYEHELKEKIRVFKLEIYKKFLKKVKEEKHNERLRKKQLEMIDDITLRNNLEIQFSDERALIDMRLRKESENLQKLAKEYENKLKSNFLKKHNKIFNLIKEINEEKENKKI